jgi:hypothetical protein
VNAASERCCAINDSGQNNLLPFHLGFESFLESLQRSGRLREIDVIDADLGAFLRILNLSALRRTGSAEAHNSQRGVQRYNGKRSTTPSAHWSTTARQTRPEPSTSSTTRPCSARKTLRR